MTGRDPATTLQDCHRILILGRTGSGKTTLARELAGLVDVPHVELDSLYFGPSFSTAPLPVLRERTSAAIAGERWVTDGNKKAVRDLVWPRADTVVWLDYPVAVSLWRLGKRAVWRTSKIKAEASALRPRRPRRPRVRPVGAPADALRGEGRAHRAEVAPGPAARVPAPVRPAGEPAPRGRPAAVAPRDPSLARPRRFLTSPPAAGRASRHPPAGRSRAHSPRPRAVGRACRDHSARLVEPVETTDPAGRACRDHSPGGRAVETRPGWSSLSRPLRPPVEPSRPLPRRRSVPTDLDPREFLVHIPSRDLIEPILSVLPGRVSSCRQRQSPRRVSSTLSMRCRACTRSARTRRRPCSSWRRRSPTSTRATRCRSAAGSCRGWNARSRSEVPAPHGSRSSPTPSWARGCRWAPGPPSGTSRTRSTCGTGCRWSGPGSWPVRPGSGTPDWSRPGPGTSPSRPPRWWTRRWRRSWTGRCRGAGSRPGWPGRIVAADPEAAAAREAERAAEQFAKRTRSSEHGTAGFYVRSTVGVIARVEATVAFLADALTAFGDRDAEDVRRVKALVLMANPVKAVELLAAFAALRARCVDVELPDPADPPDVPGSGLDGLDQPVRRLGSGLDGLDQPVGNGFASGLDGLDQPVAGEVDGALGRMDAFARRVGFEPRRLPPWLTARSDDGPGRRRPAGAKVRVRLVAAAASFDDVPAPLRRRPRCRTGRGGPVGGRGTGHARLRARAPETPALLRPASGHRPGPPGTGRRLRDPRPAP